MIGAPGTRITRDAAAPAQGQGFWGVQPSGPLQAIPRKLNRRATLAVAVAGQPQGDARPLGILPKPATLDYAHKLTSTTLLILGVIGYLLFGPRRLPRALSQLATKHVA